MIYKRTSEEKVAEIGLQAFVGATLSRSLSPWLPTVYISSLQSPEGISRPTRAYYFPKIDAFIRAKVESAYHPSCSCKMGSAQDPMAVVDPETRVYGCEGLRVVDSSIMPSITTGNLNAPTIMLAEKAADHILGGGILPPENAPFYVAPNWQSAQR